MSLHIRFSQLANHYISIYTYKSFEICILHYRDKIDTLKHLDVKVKNLTFFSVLMLSKVRKLVVLPCTSVKKHLRN